MNKIVGIRFKPAGKIYDFDCGAFVLKIGDQVIVEKEQGLGFGVVTTEPQQREEKEGAPPLKKVYRMATDQDQIKLQKNVEMEKKAYEFCREKVKELGLEMHLFTVEATFDAKKMTFFFTAEGRVDFRQLVKILVKEFRIRIEMRQVGIRNQAKMCGGVGRCGRETCCSAYMDKFDPVSIRMAKEQGLSLNPTKISGQCGRLMCCLNFENQTYVALKKAAPKIGSRVYIDGREAKVLRHNIICNRMAVKFEDDTEVEVRIDAIAPNAGVKTAQEA